MAAGAPFALATIDATFAGFAELDGPLSVTTQIDADLDFGADVVLTLAQFGTDIAHCRIELAPFPQ